MSWHNVIGLFAHPDDETIMAGGTLAMLHERGVRTHLVSATRGEGGEAGEPPVVEDRRQLGMVREAELRCAAAALGVTSLTFLDYIDPAIGPDEQLTAFEADFEALVARLARLIAAKAADLVISHGPDGEYGHPAHQLMFAAAQAAVARSGDHLLHYSVAPRLPGVDDRLWNQSRTAHLALDITPWAEAKVAAMECHVSQHALFKRRRQLQTVREAVRLIEPFYREHPPVDGAAPDDWFAALLRAAGALDIAAATLVSDFPLPKDEDPAT